MNKLKIFISSVQNEFAEERKQLSQHFKTDAVLSSFFDNGLKEPQFDFEEGFKVTIWRPFAGIGTLTDHDSGQVSGQASGQVTEEVKRVLLVVLNDMKSAEIQDALQLKHREYFRENYISPALEQGFIEMTIPDKPNSPIQKYHLTAKGIEIKNSLFKHILDAYNPKPDHDTEHDTEHDGGNIDPNNLAHNVIYILDGEMSRNELMEKLDLKHRPNFMAKYITPALDSKWIEMTIPESSKSKKQKYRLTQKGLALKKQLKQKK